MDWILLQLSDSAFPTGGFAHSGGLEAAVRLGEVDRSSLRSFAEQSLWQAGFVAVPLVRCAHEDSSAVAGLDALCHAVLTSHVASQASRTQGRAFVSTSSKVFGIPAIATLEDAVRNHAIHGHHAPLFGAVLGSLGVDRQAAQGLLLHQVLRGLGGAAVRLGLLGPHEAQRLHYDLAPLATQVLRVCGDLPLDEIAQPAPVVDVVGSVHDRLYARLFLS